MLPGDREGSGVRCSSVKPTTPYQFWCRHVRHHKMEPLWLTSGESLADKPYVEVTLAGGSLHEVVSFKVAPSFIEPPSKSPA